MDVQAGMLARLFERSMGLRNEWEVTGVWFKEREGAQDELHVRVAHRRGQAVECPVCHRKCGTCDTRERTLWHLSIWQYDTIVHCAVPRADCPKNGVHVCRIPWEVRPKTHFTALFKAQAISDGALWHERDAGRAAAARDSPRAYGTCWARP